MRRLTIALHTASCVVLAPALAAAGDLAARSAAVLFTPPACGVAPFSDVPTGHPFCDWIRQLAQDGISDGCGGGRFCPDDPVTRAQMARLLERAMRGTAAWDPGRGLYDRTVIVNPVPGDEEASGARLLALLAGITDASASRRYLLWLEPGTYDLGGAQLQMKSYVTVQGAHRSSVAIRTSRSSWGAVGALNASLRSISFQNSGAFASVHGIDLSGGGSLAEVGVTAFGGTTSIAIRTPRSLEDVSASAGGSGSSTGIQVTGAATLSRVEAFTTNGDVERGIHVDTAGNVVIEHSAARTLRASLQGFAIHVESTGASSSVTLRDVIAESRDLTTDSPVGAGLCVTDGTVVVEDSRLGADSTGDAYGVSCDGAAADTRIDVHNSRLIGFDATVYAPDADCTVRVGGSQLQGGAVDDGDVGDVRCVALYGDGFTSPGINDCF